MTDWLDELDRLERARFELPLWDQIGRAMTSDRLRNSLVKHAGELIELARLGQWLSDNAEPLLRHVENDAFEYGEEPDPEIVSVLGSLANS